MCARTWKGSVAGIAIQKLPPPRSTRPGPGACDLFRYDASSGQYVFNWDTKPLASNPALGQGTYVPFVDLGDGVQSAVLLSLSN